MALWVEDPDKQREIRDYFASINSMALRIIEAQETAKFDLKDQWDNLTVEEQENKIDDFIVPPFIKKRYANIQTPLEVSEQKDIISTFPTLKMDTGQKDITLRISSNEDDQEDNDKHSDSIIKWKDEHSEPFCWETKSQMNMRLPSIDADSKSQSNIGRGKVVVDPTNVNVHVPTENKAIPPSSVQTFSSIGNVNSNNGDFSRTTKSIQPVQKTHKKNDYTPQPPTTKKDAVTDILDSLNNKGVNEPQSSIIVTSSNLENGSSKIEITTTNYGKQDFGYKNTKSKDEIDSEKQSLLVNPGHSPEIAPRLSGFDFLDNW